MSQDPMLLCFGWKQENLFSRFSVCSRQNVEKCVRGLRWRSCRPASSVPPRPLLPREVTKVIVQNAHEHLNGPHHEITNAMEAEAGRRRWSMMHDVESRCGEAIKSHRKCTLHSPQKLHSHFTSSELVEDVIHDFLSHVCFFVWVPCICICFTGSAHLLSQTFLWQQLPALLRERPRLGQQITTLKTAVWRRTKINFID